MPELVANPPANHAEIADVPPADQSGALTSADVVSMSLAAGSRCQSYSPACTGRPTRRPSSRWSAQPDATARGTRSRKIRGIRADPGCCASRCLQHPPSKRPWWKYWFATATAPCGSWPTHQTLPAPSRQHRHRRHRGHPTASPARRRRDRGPTPPRPLPRPRTHHPTPRRRRRCRSYPSSISRPQGVRQVLRPQRHTRDSSPRAGPRAGPVLAERSRSSCPVAPRRRPTPESCSGRRGTEQWKYHDPCPRCARCGHAPSRRRRVRRSRHPHRLKTTPCSDIGPPFRDLSNGG
jgi:hypothetical protein